MAETLGLQNFFSRCSRILPVTTAAAFVCLVGLVDYATGFEISFSVFYLLPVGMTALMAALGLLPMALSKDVGAETSRPFAVVIIGGLATATLVTLFILPLLYPWFERGPQAQGHGVRPHEV